MFRVSNNGFAITETNDTHDLYDIFLGLTGDEEVSKEAWVSASNMRFGDKKEVDGYLIEQFDETKEPRMETQGRWERVGSDGIVCCSVCGIPLNKTHVCWPDGGNEYYYIATKYCPHCGARNEKGDCDG